MMELTREYRTYYSGRCGRWRIITHHADLNLQAIAHKIAVVTHTQDDIETEEMSIADAHYLRLGF